MIKSNPQLSLSGFLKQFGELLKLEVAFTIKVGISDNLLEAVVKLALMELGEKIVDDFCRNELGMSRVLDVHELPLFCDLSHRLIKLS